MGLLRALPVVRIVEECLGDVHRGEVRGQLGLTFDPGEVEVPLVDQLPHGMIGADLTFEQLRRQLLAVVVDLRYVPLQPFPTCGHPRLLNSGRAAHDLPLVDLLYVHPERAHPLIGVRHRG